MLADKIDAYREHQYARWVLLVREERVAVELHERGDGFRWTVRRMSDPDEAITLAGLGEVCRLGDLYGGLFPEALRAKPHAG